MRSENVVIQVERYFIQLETMVARKFDQSFVRQVGNEAVNLIKQRTLAGHDVYGSRFVPYSWRYLIYKFFFARYAGHPDLWFWGDMLNAMECVPTSKDSLQGYIHVRAKLQRPLPLKFWNPFLTTADLAMIHNYGLGFVPRREFLGWIEGSLEDLLLRRYVSRLVMDLIFEHGN